jgi:hypothetical protein
MRTTSIFFSFVCAALLAGCSSELKVSELEPEHGTYMGGEEITIRGSNFPKGRSVQVRFGKHDATNVVIESDRKMRVTSPAGDKNASVDVQIVFDDGKAFLLKNAFKYVDAQAAGRGMLDKMTNKMNEDQPKKPDDKKPEEKKPEEKK